MADVVEVDVADYDAVIVGAGFSGLSILHRLRENGLAVRAFEMGSGPGGVWFWNRYPGLSVDVPAMQYTLRNFRGIEQEWSWTHRYSSRDDIEQYVNFIVDKFDLRKDIEFDSKVTAARWGEDQCRWRVEATRGGPVSAKYLVSAAGPLSATNVPPFEGVDAFRGRSYHTSQWPVSGVDVADRRVGVIGTGSTGIQITPALAPHAKHLHVFQRTPNFSLPLNNGPLEPEVQADWKENHSHYLDKARHSPGGAVITEYPDRSAHSVSAEVRERIFENAWGQYLELMTCFNDIATDSAANEYVAEFVRKKIKSIVKDPKIAELLTPRDHPIGTKRICFDVGYYEMFNNPKVTLVDVRTDPIRRITARGIETDASKYELDVIVYATGFDAISGSHLRLGIVGRDDTPLAKRWEFGPRTYLGLASAGFPNLFMILGPGSPSVLSTVPTSIEQHVEFVAGIIDYLEKTGHQTIEATGEAEDDWTQHVTEVANLTLHPKADSWYMGANIPGKPRVILGYMGGVGAYRAKCEEVAAAGYRGFELR